MVPGVERLFPLAGVIKTGEGRPTDPPEELPPGEPPELLPPDELPLEDPPPVQPLQAILNP